LSARASLNRWLWFAGIYLMSLAAFAAVMALLRLFIRA
jgi:hypothetical protein